MMKLIRQYSTNHWHQVLKVSSILKYSILYINVIFAVQGGRGGGTNQNV